MYLCTYIHTMEVRRPLLSWIAAHWTVSCDCLHALVHSDAPLYSPEIRPLWIMSAHMHALYRPVLQLYKCPPVKGYVHVACFACTCVSVCVPRDIKQPYCLIGVGHLGGMSHVQENSHKGRGSAKGHEHTRQELQHVSWYHLWVGGLWSRKSLNEINLRLRGHSVAFCSTS